MQRDEAVLVDIALACREISRFIASLSQEQFTANSLVRSAVIYQLQVIGEATKRLSAEFRDRHPAVRWKEMAGMRDRLIHHYDDINLGIVWQVASQEVPALLSYLEPLMPNEGNS
jgi:uncharacterized protein with HEPN domain